MRLWSLWLTRKIGKSLTFKIYSNVRLSLFFKALIWSAIQWISWKLVDIGILFNSWHFSQSAEIGSENLKWSWAIFWDLFIWNLFQNALDSLNFFLQGIEHYFPSKIMAHNNWLQPFNFNSIAKCSEIVVLESSWEYVHI